jgi:hypothetical protein
MLASPELNPSMERLAHAIALGHSIYCNGSMQQSRNNTAVTTLLEGRSPVVLFVVQQGEKNVMRL